MNHAYDSFLGGVGEVVEIDECLLRGRQKANKGRLTRGDIEETEERRRKRAKRGRTPRLNPGTDNFADAEPEDDGTEHGDEVSGDDDNEDDDDDDDQLDDQGYPGHRRNYGNRVDGPWVLGLAWRRSEEWKKENRRGAETRFFLVDRRDRATLKPIIQRHVMPGTTIHTGEWGAYGLLDQIGFLHQTVNHTRNFVDPITGANMQLIESFWNRLRHSIVRTARNVRRENLPKWLAACWWRSLYRHPKRGTAKDIFECFLRLVANVYLHY